MEETLSKIIIRKGAGTPPTLDVGEFGLDTTNNKLYIGTTNGNKEVVNEDDLPEGVELPTFKTVGNQSITGEGNIELIKKIKVNDISLETDENNEVNIELDSLIVSELKINEVIFDSQKDPIITGSYVAGNGATGFNTLATTFLSENYIPIKNATKLLYTGTLPGSTYVAFYREADAASFQGQEAGSKSNFVMTVPEGSKFMRVSGTTTTNLVVSVVEVRALETMINQLKDTVVQATSTATEAKNDLTFIDERVKVYKVGDRLPYIVTIGKYISASGDPIVHGTNYKITNMIPCLNIEKLNYSVTGGGNLGLNTAICFYTNNTMSSQYAIASGKVIGPKNNIELTVPANAKYVAFSFMNANDDQLNVTVTEVGDSILDQISKKVDEDPNFQIELSKAFYKKVLFIGDSMTAGWRGGQGDVKTLGYPSFIEGMSGWTCTNTASGGQTPTGWYTTHANNQTYTDYHAAVIWLGQNQGLSDTLDADIKAFDLDGVPGSGYENYTANNTGYYGKIIGKILAENAKTKIFLIKGTAASTTGATWNIVQKIADYFKLPVITPLTESFSPIRINDALGHPYFNDWPDTNTARDVVHYGSLGYFVLAKNIFFAMCRHIYNNPQEYSTFFEDYRIHAKNTSTVSFTVTTAADHEVVATTGTYSETKYDGYKIVKVSCTNATVKITYNGEEKVNVTDAGSYSFRIENDTLITCSTAGVIEITTPHT